MSKLRNLKVTKVKPDYLLVYYNPLCLDQWLPLKQEVSKIRLKRWTAASCQRTVWQTVHVRRHQLLLLPFKQEVSDSPESGSPQTVAWHKFLQSPDSLSENNSTKSLERHQLTLTNLLSLCLCAYAFVFVRVHLRVFAGKIIFWF